jgi:hypothetical protein
MGKTSVMIDKPIPTQSACAIDAATLGVPVGSGQAIQFQLVGFS